MPAMMPRNARGRVTRKKVSSSPLPRLKETISYRASTDSSAARADFTMMGSAITAAATTAPSHVNATVQPFRAYR